MNPADLLAATFAEHEPDASDVTLIRLGIEAQLSRASRTRPSAITAAAAAAATVVGVALLATIVHSRPDTHGQHDGFRPVPAGSAHATPSRSSMIRSSASPTTAVLTPTAQPGQMFPYRTGWLPAHARFDVTNVGDGGLDLVGYRFGTVSDTVRGLTLWSDGGPLPKFLRDGGTLRHTTVRGCSAVEGWSPSSRTYTVAILRPHNWVMTVIAYGWNRTTAKTYATHTAQDVRYGSFPAPTTSH